MSEAIRPIESEYGLVFGEGGVVNEERGGLVLLMKVIFGEGYVLIQSAEG